ncbi:uncharacterized protein HaLaN_31282 [Haematococcus lacustris]|uniref:Uncharacterized protein n=1 Tax=Haematococcus lacustris TaxID=44745 RepID=A0A6A0AHJ3_HAELA|nr:uncharacterized protein HaLaN_31282 [Haematococcus lacustris]
MEVGEALCVLGTTDFGSRDNCTRAINSKDYAYLLTLYGEAFWALYKKDFIDGLSEHVQDEMLTMRGLLTTRFESNAVLQDQLIKAVGLEPQGGGGALVINTSVNTVHSKPSNTVHSNVSALAKVSCMLPASAAVNATPQLGPVSGRAGWCAPCDLHIC